MRLAYPPTTLRSRVHRYVPWIAILLLLPAAVAQGQPVPGTSLPGPSLPVFTEPLSQRFFPPFNPSGTQTLTLTPFVSLGERYDDNIFLTSPGKANDFITLPAVGIRLKYVPSRVTALDFDYRIDGQIFAKHSDQDAVSHQGAFRFASRINPYLSVNVRDTLVSTTEPLQKFATIDEATGLRQLSQERRVRTLRNTAGASVGVRLAERATVDLLFEHFIYDVNIPEELNETRYSIGAEVGYLTDVARESRAYVSYKVTFFTFDPNGPTGVALCRPNGPTGVNRCADFQVHNVTAGFRHSFSPTLSGNATLGYATTQSNEPTADNLGGVVASVNVTKQLRDGQIAVGYNRNVTSGGGAGGVVREDALVATFFWKATPKVTAIFASKFALFDFRGQSTSGNTSDRSFLSLRPGLAYQILPLWNLAFYYRYEYTNFYRGSPDTEDQRFSLISQLALREHVFLSLTYDYAVRHLRDIPVNTLGLQQFTDLQAFNRNQVMLLLTYAPTFRF